MSSTSKYPPNATSAKSGACNVTEGVFLYGLASLSRVLTWPRCKVILLLLQPEGLPTAPPNAGVAQLCIVGLQSKRQEQYHLPDRASLFAS